MKIVSPNQTTVQPVASIKYPQVELMVAHVVGSMRSVHYSSSVRETQDGNTENGARRAKRLR